MRSMSTASVVLAIATLVPVTAGAQTHNHGAAQPASPPAGSVVTVTGCLARGAAPDSFVLQNVAWKSVNVPTGQEPGAAKPSPSGQATSETLRLAGAASTLKLDSHVGHTINATGTLGKADPIVTPGIVLPDPPPQGDTTSRQAAEAEAKAKAGASHRLLLMKSLEHVAPQCK